MPLVQIQRLDWDTRFFGAQMGTLRLAHTSSAATEVLEGELRAALRKARDDGYQHLIARVSAADLPAVWALERAGLRLVDIGIDSTIGFGATTADLLPARSVIRAARPEETPALSEMGEAFTLSRFSADPFFTETQVRDFHRQWITNLCNGLAAAVLVCEQGNELAGFVACMFDGSEGRIALIASHSKFRRQGLGRELVNASLRWFAGAGAQVAHVKTQAHNYPALALYHSAGFAISKTQLTFSTELSRAA